MMTKENTPNRLAAPIPMYDAHSLMLLVQLATLEEQWFFMECRVFGTEGYAKTFGLALADSRPVEEGGGSYELLVVDKAQTDPDSEVARVQAFGATYYLYMDDRGVSRKFAKPGGRTVNIAPVFKANATHQEPLSHSFVWLAYAALARGAWTVSRGHTPRDLLEPIMECISGPISSGVQSILKDRVQSSVSRGREFLVPILLKPEGRHDFSPFWALLKGVQRESKFAVCVVLFSKLPAGASLASHLANLLLVVKASFDGRELLFLDGEAKGVRLHNTASLGAREWLTGDLVLREVLAAHLGGTSTDGCLVRPQTGRNWSTFRWELLRLIASGDMDAFSRLMAMKGENLRST
jgi:hypothetical protein